MTNQAQHAIRAAKNAHVWGLFAATRYARSKGVHCNTFLLALRLEAQRLAAVPIFLRKQAE